MPDELLTFFIKIIFFIEIHEVKIVVIPISDEEELSLKDVVHLINQIYFTEKQIQFYFRESKEVLVHHINIKWEGWIDQVNHPICKTVYFPDKNIRYNVNVPAGSCGHYDLIVSNIRNNNGALLLI